MEPADQSPVHRKASWAASLLALVLIVYPLSSGPVLAAAFWMREATGIDAFYSVMWLYFPILKLPRPLWDAYIGWWVNLFGTVGPG
jgi:hypothetical protein